MAWFGIRTVYLFGQKSDGTNVFEERIVCIEAHSADAALEKGTLESEKYAADRGFEAHAEREAYEQDGDALVDGYEVWSTLFESRKSLSEFYDDRYVSYDYQPE